jgi:hypothetical protein
LISGFPLFSLILKISPFLKQKVPVLLCFVTGKAFKKRELFKVTGGWFCENCGAIVGLDIVGLDIVRA